MTMLLPRAGREYATWTVDTTDSLSNFEVQLVDGGPWIPATYADGKVRLLVRGPDCPDTPDAHLIEAPSCRPTLRCTDTPELVIRRDGPIVLV